MIRRFIVSGAFILLLLSSSAFAQGGFSVAWIYADQPGLTTTCNGSTYLPDGTIIKIYWDTNSNGPDASDPLATVCAVPPECETGPSGTCNYNQFELNGVSYVEQAGCFYSVPQFTSVGQVPTPPLYYLVIFQPDGITRLWTSSVKTVVAGYQEIWLQQSDWVCGSGLPQCVVRDEHE